MVRTMTKVRRVLRVGMLLCVAVLISGCTLTLENPLVKKESPEIKQINSKIEALELLEREAELVQSITEKKVATELAKKPAPAPVQIPGPQGEPGEKGEKGDPGRAAATIDDPNSVE